MEYDERVHRHQKDLEAAHTIRRRLMQSDSDRAYYCQGVEEEVSEMRTTREIYRDFLK